MKTKKAVQRKPGELSGHFSWTDEERQSIAARNSFRQQHDRAEFRIEEFQISNEEKKCDAQA